MGDKRFGHEKQLHECLFREGVKHPEESIYYIFICRVVLGYFVTTKDGEVDVHSRQPVFAGAGKRELSTIPDLSPPVHYHALLAETGGMLHRYREFMQYHAARIYPEYLIAYKRR